MLRMESGLSMKRRIDSEIVTPALLGILYWSPLNAAGTWQKPCWMHAGAQIPTFLCAVVKFFRESKSQALYESMKKFSVSLHFSFEYAPVESSLLRHLVPTIFCKLLASYWDWTINMGAFWYLATLPKSKQSRLFPTSLTQAVRGIYVQAFTNLDSVWNDVDKKVWLVKGFLKLPTNNPLSGIAYTILLRDWSSKQFDHMNVAKPPADSPMMTTLLALYRPQVQLRYAKFTRVLLDPLKQRSVSLQLMGLNREPWNMAPSQYGMNTLVQFQKLGLIYWSEDSTPNASRSCVSAYFFELPRSVFDRSQQLSRTSDKLDPPQYPPPVKNTSMLKLDSPGETQMAEGDPSRHLAPVSTLCRYLVQGAELVTASRTINTRSACIYVLLVG